MSVDWNGYEPYVPPHYGPLAEMSRREARECFNHLMAAKSDRINQLRTLMKANGITLGDDDLSVQRLNDWFRANVAADPENPERLRSLWYGVVNDVALYLGDIMIARTPHLHWEMFTSGRRNVVYQQHVIMGFRGVANPKYNADVDGVVATYAHRIIRGDVSVDPKLFVNMLAAAQSKA
jgi:hypothetical protein